jgi:hypothetical protein
MKLNSKLGTSKLVLGASLLGLTALLSACGGGEVITDPPAQPTAIFGTLTPFTAGSADTIREQDTGITAPIAVSGNFDLTLLNVGAQYPNLLSTKDNTFAGCDPGAVITGPDNFKSFQITRLFSDKGGVQVAENVQGSITVYKTWWFATVPGTLNINAKCLFLGTINQSLTFTQGWNVIDISVNGTSTTLTRAADQNPGRLVWKDKKSAQSLDAQAIKPYTFNPWR